MKYVDQSSNILEYHLFVHSNIDFSQFTVLSDKIFSFKDINVYMGIIGESHFFSIENQLTELFACVKPKEKSFYYSKFRDSFSYAKSINDISFATTFIKVSELKRIYPIINSFEKEHDLLFSFPSSKKDLFPAITSLKTKQHKNILTLETIHAYPNEKSIILSSSTFIF